MSVEKLVVEQGGYSGLDVAAISNLVNANRGMSPEALMALCQKNGHSGENLFTLILLLILLGGNGNGLGFGGNNQSQQMFDTRVLEQAIAQNANAIGQLATTFNCDFGRMYDAIGTIRGSIDKVAGEVGTSSQAIINAVQRGDCDISRQISECCCGIKTEILRQTNEVQQGFCHTDNLIQSKSAETNNIIQQGFASVGFQQSQDKCEILSAIKADGEATRSLVRDLDRERLRDENQALKLQVSQAAQSASIESNFEATLQRTIACLFGKYGFGAQGNNGHSNQSH